MMLQCWYRAGAGLIEIHSRQCKEKPSRLHKLNIGKALFDAFLVTTSGTVPVVDKSNDHAHQYRKVKECSAAARTPVIPPEGDGQGDADVANDGKSELDIRRR